PVGATGTRGSRARCSLPVPRRRSSAARWFRVRPLLAPGILTDEVSGRRATPAAAQTGLRRLNRDATAEPLCGDGLLPPLHTVAHLLELGRQISRRLPRIERAERRREQVQFAFRDLTQRPARLAGLAHLRQFVERDVGLECVQL